MSKDKAIWLVYSREHNAFWRPNRAGYTVHMEAAGRYTEAQAKEACSSCDYAHPYNPPDFMVPAPEAIK